MIAATATMVICFHFDPFQLTPPITWKKRAMVCRQCTTCTQQQCSSRWWFARIFKSWHVQDDYILWLLEYVIIVLWFEVRALYGKKVIKIKKINSMKTGEIREMKTGGIREM